MKSFILFLVLVTPLSFLVKATSIKMDFLSMGTVRTDPLMFSQFGNCLSDHVHRFYGATSSRTMRPDATFQDLRSAKGNTGNVEENHSLYWNPAIYKVKNPNGDKTFEIVDVWFASAYYVFRTGQTQTFPSGLKMKTFGSQKLTRATATCDGKYRCEREDNGGCDGYGPSNQAEHGFLPLTGCSELEINIKFPTCWDGKNIEAQDADDHHVVYSLECDGDKHNECFDFDCPASHPVKLPEIHLYVRILGYEGGAHMFADGSDHFHSDYFSGWDEKELQKVLDNCENDSDAASPDAYCSDWLTFRVPKHEGHQVDDDDIRSGLDEIQPDPIDTKGTISSEEVTNISEVPRGFCIGTLIPDNGPPPTSNPPHTTSPSSTTTPPSEGCGSPQWKGDGYCNDENNNAKCDYDDGDCCGENVITEDCNICECRDPDFSGCGSPQWKGDGYCNDENNNANCNYDDGDCCGDNVITEDCNICECKDPDPWK